MKFLKSLIVCLALATRTHCAEDDHDDHDHGHGKHKCACEAEEFGFKIDCANTKVMLAALAELQSNGCTSECSSAICEKNYLIVQSHHDYCPEAGIPEPIEDGFHDFDESCTACAITRQAIEGVEDCPEPVCDGKTGSAAYVKMQEDGCLSDCSSEDCIQSYFTLLSVHDGCPHDDLSQAAEVGFHDIEEACANAQCTSGDEDQLVCDSHDDGDDHDSHDHGSHDSHDHSGAAGKAAMVGTVATVMAILVQMCSIVYNKAVVKYMQVFLAAD